MCMYVCACVYVCVCVCARARARAWTCKNEIIVPQLLLPKVEASHWAHGVGCSRLDAPCESRPWHVRTRVVECIKCPTQQVFSFFRAILGTALTLTDIGAGTSSAEHTHHTRNVYPYTCLSLPPRRTPPESKVAYKPTGKPWQTVQLPHDGLIAATASNHTHEPDGTACPGGCSGRSFIPVRVPWSAWSARRRSVCVVCCSANLGSCIRCGVRTNVSSIIYALRVVSNTNFLCLLVQRHVLWYRKEFKIPAAWKGSAFWLDFEGAFRNTTGSMCTTLLCCRHVPAACGVCPSSRHTVRPDVLLTLCARHLGDQVWINGKIVAQHVCGYTPFRVRMDNITDVKVCLPHTLSSQF